jgi:hypothetical protein
MLSHRSLTALRVAATLAHTLPDMGARVRVGRRVLLDVRPAPPEGAATVSTRSISSSTSTVTLGPKILTTCAFRCSVAHAYHRELAGERLAFLGLPAGCEPSIDIATPRGGTVRPGGIYRVPHGDRWMWGMATTLESREAYEAGLDLVEDVLPIDGLEVLGLRPDPGTGVTVLYADTAAAPDTPAEAALIDLLVALLGRWTAHELITAVQHPSPAEDVRGSGGGSGGAA